MLPRQAPGSKPVKRLHGPQGKRVVFVTPHPVAAKDEAEKHAKMGKKVEIKKEKDDMGQVVYVVYVFETGF